MHDDEEDRRNVELLGHALVGRRSGPRRHGSGVCGRLPSEPLRVDVGQPCIWRLSSATSRWCSVCDASASRSSDAATTSARRGPGLLYFNTAVRAELRTAVALLHIAFAPLSLTRSTMVGVSDACESGWVAHEASWPAAAVETHRRWSERWRFKHGAGDDPRARALAGPDAEADGGRVRAPRLSRCFGCRVRRSRDWARWRWNGGWCQPKNAQLWI